MSSRNKRLKKADRGHQSQTDASEVIVRAADKLSEVTKIRRGPIKWGTRPGNRHCVFREITGGWEIKVVGNNSTQMLYVYTNDKPRTRATLEAIEL